MPDLGEIWLADLSPPHGTKPGKTRPGSRLAGASLAQHPSTYIIPLTTKLVNDAEPLKMRIPAAGKLPRDSDLLMDQMRAIDNRRLIRGPLHRLPPATMKREVIALLEILGMQG